MKRVYSEKGLIVLGKCLLKELKEQDSTMQVDLPYDNFTPKSAIKLAIKYGDDGATPGWADDFARINICSRKFKKFKEVF